MRFALTSLSEEGDLVFDPFAGSGTVAIESTLTSRDYEVWDLNPMLDLLVRASTFREPLETQDLALDFDYDDPWYPRWYNSGY